VIRQEKIESILKELMNGKYDYTTPMIKVKKIKNALSEIMALDKKPVLDKEKIADKLILEIVEMYPTIDGRTIHIRNLRDLILIIKENVKPLADAISKADIIKYE
jgi:hypothetical protein